MLTKFFAMAMVVIQSAAFQVHGGDLEHNPASHDQEGPTTPESDPAGWPALSIHTPFR